MKLTADGATALIRLMQSINGDKTARECLLELGPVIEMFDVETSKEVREVYRDKLKKSELVDVFVKIQRGYNKLMG